MTASAASAMPDNITINVTQPLIDNGCREESNNCPIALAIKEQVPGVIPTSIEVDGERICFAVYDDTEYAFYSVPGVEDFVIAFDTDGPEAVEPFTFVLNMKEGRLYGDYDDPDYIDSIDNT